MPEILNVYLAGKISKNDWRHELFPIRGADPTLYDPKMGIDQPIVDGMRYVGPFFLSCDHGCLHGPSSHGRGASGLPITGTVKDAWPHDIAYGCGNELPEQSRRAIFEKCLKWLAEAEIVFVWVDGTDIYGTFVEIGIAVALGIPVYIAVQREASKRYNIAEEMWFAWAATWSEYNAFDNVKDAWRAFVEAARPLIKAHQSALSKEWNGHLKAITRISIMERFGKFKPRLDFSIGSISPKLRFDVFRRDGFRCQYCGATSKETKLEVDHIVPVSKGGASTIDNLITACINCNRGKATSDVVAA